MTFRSLIFTLALLFPLYAFGQSADAEAPAAIREAGQQVIDSQFKAFRNRAHEEAFGYASPNLKRLFGSTERFIGMVKGGYGAIYDAREWSFGRSRMQGEELYQEVFVSDPTGKDWRALYTLQQDADGIWRITSVRLIPGGTLGT